jgi:hypothetical protein
VSSDDALDQDASAMRAVSLASAEAKTTVYSAAHLMQILAQMVCWGVSYARYTVASAHKILYSVVLWAPPDLLSAFEALLKRELEPLLAPFKPLYNLNLPALSNPDVVQNIVNALVAEHGEYLDEGTIALVASHLPRVVALRRRVTNPFVPLHPARVIKNLIAFDYNKNKGGVDRMSQGIAKIMSLFDFWDGFLSTTVLRRVVMLLSCAVQAQRVREATAKLVGETFTHAKFSRLISRGPSLIDTVIGLGKTMLVSREALVTAPSSGLSAAAAAPNVLAEALGMGSAGLSSTSGTHTTPTTRTRQRWTQMFQDGALSQRVDTTPVVLNLVTVERGNFLADLVEGLRVRVRAPRRNFWNSDQGRLVRRSQELNHTLEQCGSTTTCVVCTSTGRRKSGVAGFGARAHGRCHTCRASLCLACSFAFHNDMDLGNPAEHASRKRAKGAGSAPNSGAAGGSSSAAAVEEEGEEEEEEEESDDA